MTVTKRIEVPKIVEVEKKLNWWQKTKIEIGGWSMIMNILLVSMMIVRWLRKKGGADCIFSIQSFVITKIFGGSDCKKRTARSLSGRSR